MTINILKLVSIIIPVYNVEKYLEQCIDSCINQTYNNLEIILVNDGSTDSSGLICEAKKSVDDRIIVIHKENEGLSSARNLGLDNAKGDYICFLDSDDWMDVDTIFETLKLSIEYDSDIVFWSCIKEFINKKEPYKVFNSKSKLDVFEGEKLNRLKRRCVGLLNEEMLNPTKTDSFISAWGKLYKTSLIKSNKLTFLPTQLVGSEDVPFNIQAFYFSNKIIYFDKYYNHYRMFNDNSLTKNHKNTLFLRFKNLYDNVFEFLNSKNVPDEFYQSLNNRFALTLINNCLSISSPKYKVSLLTKFNDIKLILNDKKFYEAIDKLNIAYMPFIWKIFFTLAKRKKHILLLLMTIIYKKIK